MKKPGYKTTEFWLTLAAILVGALLASGVLPTDGTWVKVVGMAASILGALGYQVTRSFTKHSDNKASVLLNGVAPKDPS